MSGIVSGSSKNGLVEVEFIPEKAQTRTNDIWPMLFNDGATRGSSNVDFGAPVSYNKSLSVAGTGLGVHSDQSFETALSMTLNHSKATTITVRLVVYDEAQAQEDLPFVPPRRTQTIVPPLLNRY